MTHDQKKVLYGAARNQRINKLRNDTMAACSEIMYARESVPVTFLHDDDEDGDIVWMSPVEAIIISLEAMLAEVARLESGRPA